MATNDKLPHMEAASPIKNASSDGKQSIDIQVDGETYTIDAAGGTLDLNGAGNGSWWENASLAVSAGATLRMSGFGRWSGTRLRCSGPRVTADIGS